MKSRGMYVFNGIVPLLTLSATVFLAISSNAEGEKVDPIPPKILKTGVTFKVTDENLYRLIEGVKKKPRYGPNVGVSGWKRWCELELRTPMLNPETSGYFRVGLDESLLSGKIENINIREIRRVDEGLHEISWGGFDNPELIAEVSGRVLSEMFERYGASLVRDIRSMYNFTFSPSWENDELYSQLNLLAKKPVAIPDNFFDELEWARPSINKIGSQNAEWNLHLLAKPKFRLFKPQVSGQKVRMIYYGEFDSEEVWDQLANYMMRESPEMLKTFAQYLRMDSETEFKVVISPLAIRDSLVKRNSIVSTIENISDSPKAFLLWDTPFDPQVTGQVFNVNDLDEEAVVEPSEEISKIERKKPTEADCVILLPGERLSSVIDLGKFYTMKPISAYQAKLEFELHFYDVVDGKIQIIGEGESVKISGPWLTLKKMSEK